LAATIRSHFSGPMSRIGVERLDAFAGDEDLDRPELGANPREPGLDRLPIPDVDFDSHRLGALSLQVSRRRFCGGGVRSRMPTLWLSSASWRATPSPMPDAPPVTTATRLTRRPRWA
jgi:hypothetical protein